MARYFLAVVFCATVPACREILPFENSSSIQGYQLNGTVTSPDGISIDSVDVRLYYDYDFVSNTPADTQQVVVTKSISFVDVAVFTPKLEFVRRLFSDYRTTGTVPRYSWNTRDANGIVVASGKYLIRYVVDTTIVKYSPVIVEGTITASTDSTGRFTLSPDRFPVDDIFDLYDANNAYAGTYKVLPSIDLDLRRRTLHASYAGIGLSKGKITSHTFILQ